MISVTHLVLYWTGTVPEGEQQERATWLPQNMEQLPLQEWDPSIDAQMMNTADEEESLP